MHDQITTHLKQLGARRIRIGYDGIGLCVAEFEWKGERCQKFGVTAADLLERLRMFRKGARKA